MTAQNPITSSILEKVPLKIICRNPATGEVIGEMPVMDVEEMDECFQRARCAQEIWAELSYDERKIHILKIRDYLVEHADAVAHAISESTGKSLNDALITEVFNGICAADWYAKQAKKTLHPKRILPSNVLFANKRSTVHCTPLGVVGIIAPWNYPFGISFGEIIMGLMAGNAIFYKVAEDTALIHRLIDEVLAAGELPAGLCQSMVGDPAPIVTKWFELGIDKLFFTGSTRVGKILMKQAAEFLVPISMELGGNDAMIVFEDANLPRAANGALWAGFQNSGQTCAAVERIYVQRSVMKPFLQLLKEKTEALRQGVDDGSQEIDIGSMTVARQLEVVRHHVADALEKGAVIVAQASLAPGLAETFYPATVLANVNHQMAVMREETFGPVVAVMAFDSEEEGIALANDSEYGLTSSVWTMNPDRAQRVAHLLQTGITTINDHAYSHACSELPWLGWKKSGMGVTHSHLGLEEMTRIKVINYDLAPQLPSNLWWFPAHSTKYEVFVETATLLFGSSWLKRKRSLQRLLPKVIKDPLLREK